MENPPPVPVFLWPALQRFVPPLEPAAGDGGRRRHEIGADGATGEGHEQHRETLPRPNQATGPKRNVRRPAAIARENIVKQRGIIAIARDRYKGGAATMLDVYQAENVLGATESNRAAALDPIAKGIERALSGFDREL